MAEGPSMTIVELVQEANRRWPSSTWTSQRCEQLLLQRAISVDHDNVLDLLWAEALAHGDAAALTQFEAIIVNDVRPALQKMSRGDDFCNEILQRMRVKLFTGTKQIAGYRGAGSLAAWVQRVVIREALMALRSEGSTKTDDDMVTIVSADPTLAILKNTYRDTFQASFRAAFSTISARERTLLRMCFLDGLGLNEIATAYNIHRATAFRWVRDARTVLLQAVREKFAATAQLEPSQLDSVLQAVATSLELDWHDSPDAT